MASQETYFLFEDYKLTHEFVRWLDKFGTNCQLKTRFFKKTIGWAG